MNATSAAGATLRDLLVAFEDALHEILKVAEYRKSFQPAAPVRLDVDEFRTVLH